jgi:hypothetical protein
MYPITTSITRLHYLIKTMEIFELSIYFFVLKVSNIQRFLIIIEKLKNIKEVSNKPMEYIYDEES